MMRQTLTAGVVAVAFVACERRCPEPAAASASSSKPPEPATSGAAKPPRQAVECTSYHKAVTGFTVRRAVYSREVIATTKAERDLLARETDEYGSFWDCAQDAKAQESTWCECTRGSNAAFEKAQSETSGAKVSWVNR